MTVKIIDLSQSYTSLVSTPSAESLKPSLTAEAYNSTFAGTNYVQNVNSSIHFMASLPFQDILLIYLQLAYTWLKHVCCIAHSRALVHVIFSSPERHIWTLFPPLDFFYTVNPEPLLSHPAEQLVGRLQAKTLQHLAIVNSKSHATICWL